MNKANKKYEEKRNIILKKIGKECREIRERLNLSQRTISILFDIEQAMISKFENGKADSATLYIMYQSLPFGGLDI